MWISSTATDHPSVSRAKQRVTAEAEASARFSVTSRSTDKREHVADMTRFVAASRVSVRQIAAVISSVSDRGVALGE